MKFISYNTIISDGCIMLRIMLNTYNNKGSYYVATLLFFS